LYPTALAVESLSAQTRDTNSKQLNIMDNIWKPHMTVAALVEQDGRFLLVEERCGGRLVYNQPAGHLEDNEGLLDAVVRETREETAWHFQPESVTGIYRWRHPVSHATYIRAAFAGRGISHDPNRPLDPEIVQTLWLSVDEIRQQQDRLRSPLVLRCIEDYLAGVAYPLALLTDIEQ
jgi:8-oxo-dGTP pyrophosphatase MutT (NUDIX family)